MIIAHGTTTVRTYCTFVLQVAAQQSANAPARTVSADNIAAALKILDASCGAVRST